jgi:putative transposase
MQPSMSRKGHCWDNAVAESFLHTLKTERIYLEDFDTHEQAQMAVFAYIEMVYEQALKANGTLCPEKC